MMINQPELQTNSDKGYLKILRIVVIVVILCIFGMSIFLGANLYLFATPPALLLILALLSSYASLKELKVLFKFACIVIVIQILFILWNVQQVKDGAENFGGLIILAIIPVALIGFISLTMFRSLMKRSKASEPNIANRKSRLYLWILGVLIAAVLAFYLI